ncbi:enoyl-CoA hydratase/isomerase family protein [Comamonas endophytica]|uniref:Enoyl-CoA hydratase/isomerase family protein n=1 Tax=Comamonas endophytica TaxID=2949090 RepID=A0ABY6GHN4_9BURK|nr:MULTISPECIES: enoyl-CoA hydratase/isomerase family protein [unclassified Acidovorax]MCD2513343.1 enoyl-CoA hydratase/isomerase family protein [Acidovorax sp. D4N7]UYG53872.1 enoyl-CoA hydratase/isomerase family protein [Acidovorax sp. 5MLIR]
MNYQNLEVQIQGPVATLWLNRPAVRNALDEVLLAEMTLAVNELERNDAVRVLVLAGRGKAFCAGADLNWMKRMASYSDAQNQADAMGLAQMLKTLHGIGKPTIARVHGAAFAGGMGLAAACDVVVAEPTAEFCLSEVRIGLIPSTISPYILQALGVQAAKRYMLTAERLSAQEAHRLGFVQALSEEGAIDATVARIAQALAAGGPRALARTKALIHSVAHRSLDEELITETAGLIAQVRASDEGREGVAAFLEKRAAGWVTQ